MAGAAGKITMKILTIAVSIPVGIATKKLTDRIFVTTRPSSELRRVDDSGVDWKDAIAWAAISGVGVAAAQLIARKGAEETYKVLVGKQPPPKPPSKMQKKVAKKAEKQAKALT